MAQQTLITVASEDGASAVSFTDKQLGAAAAVVTEPLLTKAAELVINQEKCSSSLVQRKLAIGYNRAARIVETLEEMGIVTSADHAGKRTVVATELPRELQLAQMANDARPMGRTPMKETVEDRQVKQDTFRVTAAELRQFIERYERLEAEKQDIADHMKEVMAEAKARGYDTKIIRKIIALRKREPDDIAEEEAVLEMYKEALGMA